MGRVGLGLEYPNSVLEWMVGANLPSIPPPNSQSKPAKPKLDEPGANEQKKEEVEKSGWNQNEASKSAPSRRQRQTSRSPCKITVSLHIADSDGETDSSTSSVDGNAASPKKNTVQKKKVRFYETAVNKKSNLKDGHRTLGFKAAVGPCICCRLHRIRNVHCQVHGVNPQHSHTKDRTGVPQCIEGLTGINYPQPDQQTLARSQSQCTSLPQNPRGEFQYPRAVLCQKHQLQTRPAQNRPQNLPQPRCCCQNHNPQHNSDRNHPSQPEPGTMNKASPDLQARPPQPPGRYVIPLRGEVIQREDVVEDPNDPRPNAFFCMRTGRLRVYHGPIYGNPFQTLLPHSQLSIGTAEPRWAFKYPNQLLGGPPIMHGHSSFTPKFHGPTDHSQQFNSDQRKNPPQGNDQKPLGIRTPVMPGTWFNHSNNGAQHGGIDCWRNAQATPNQQQNQHQNGGCVANNSNTSPGQQSNSGWQQSGADQSQSQQNNYWNSGGEQAQSQQNKSWQSNEQGNPSAQNNNGSQGGAWGDSQSQNKWQASDNWNSGNSNSQNRPCSSGPWGNEPQSNDVQNGSNSWGNTNGEPKDGGNDNNQKNSGGWGSSNNANESLSNNNDNNNNSPNGWGAPSQPAPWGDMSAAQSTQNSGLQTSGNGWGNNGGSNRSANSNGGNAWNQYNSSSNGGNSWSQDNNNHGGGNSNGGGFSDQSNNNNGGGAGGDWGQNNNYGGGGDGGGNWTQNETNNAGGGNWGQDDSSGGNSWGQNANNNNGSGGGDGWGNNNSNSAGNDFWNQNNSSGGGNMW